MVTRAIWVGAQFSAPNFSKIRGPVCKIPWLTTANFPHVVINLLQLPEPDQICSICCHNCNWQIQCVSVYQINWQYLFRYAQINIFNIPLVRAKWQSCISWWNRVLYIQQLIFMAAWTWPKYAVLSPCHWPVPNSAKFRGSRQIPQLCSKFCFPLKTGPYIWAVKLDKRSAGNHLTKFLFSIGNV